MALRLAFATALVTLALGYVMFSAAATTLPPPQAGQAPSLTPIKGQWLGAGSCSSVGCHNANGFKGEQGSEFTTWILHDPHARAYEVLFNAKSRLIVRNLYPSGGKPAHELARCLDCHVHENYEAYQPDHHPRFSKEDGVSCESCHGPASSYISDHYKQGLTEPDKRAMGMRDTRTLVGRVRSCTPCHVGANGMEVNHDLIAAGHPRLAFEFSAYHALIPHHWQDSKDKIPGASERARPDWDSQAWLVGQAVTSQAALELLAARSKRTNWPEFAETDCYACHHQLEAQGWRRDLTLKGGDSKPGSMSWNDWYSGSLPYDLPFFGPNPKDQGKAIAQVKKAIAKVKRAMEGKVMPDRLEVCDLAAEAGKALEGWVQQIERAQIAPADLAVALETLATAGADSKKQAKSWDEAAQRYLAVVAMYSAWQGEKRLQPAPDLRKGLEGIRSLLQFSPQADSPRREYTPEELQKRYVQLLKQMKR